MNQVAKKIANPANNLAREMEAAEILKSHLRTVLGEQETAQDEDSQLLLDMIEGETGLLETIDVVLGQIGQDKSNIEGIEKFEGSLKARKDRMERRVEMMRAMLVNTLEILEQRRFERPIATLTLKDVPAKLQIVNEVDIPSLWWKQGDPSLDKRALGDALKERQRAIDELRESRKAMSEDVFAQKLAAIEITYPPIPGAELGASGVTVQIRYS